MTESAEERQSYGVRLRPSFKKQLDTVAAERGVYLYELIEDGMRIYLSSGEEKEGPIVPAKFRPYLQWFAELLASGNANITEALTRSIDVYREHLRALQGHPGKR